MSIATALLLTLLYIAGIIICLGKLESGIVFKCGLWFFSLRIAATILDAIRNFVVLPIILRERVPGSRINLLIQLANIPSILLGIAAYIILVYGFFRQNHMGIKSEELR
jgi:hypothetical protein